MPPAKPRVSHDDGYRGNVQLFSIQFSATSESPVTTGKNVKDRNNVSQVGLLSCLFSREGNGHRVHKKRIR
jgi:hypothetical protein